MNTGGDGLMTPLYLKTHPEMPWPAEEGAFYVLSSSGLFLCRNQPFFKSSVPAPSWPSELSEQSAFLSLNCPKIPRRQFELLIGFFDHMATRHGAEAAALIVWEEKPGRIRFRIPSQTARVGVSYGGYRYPIGLSYEDDRKPEAGQVILGDVHSHCQGAAYASAVDQHDEIHRPGLHVVVGRIDWEPPEFACQFVVDGTRFRIQNEEVLEGYGRRRHNVPEAWLRQVKIEAPKGTYCPAGEDQPR